MAVQNVGFFGMLHGIYGAVAALASAFQRGANSLDNLGKWAEQQTGVFVDEATIERDIKLEELKRRRVALGVSPSIPSQNVTDVIAKPASQEVVS